SPASSSPARRSTSGASSGRRASPCTGRGCSEPRGSLRVQRFRSRNSRASAVGLVLAAACSVQGGAAVAKSLFATLGPPGVVFLRLLFGSIALWAIARPELRGWTRRDLGLVVALGIVFVSM